MRRVLYKLCRHDQIGMPFLLAKMYQRMPFAEICTYMEGLWNLYLWGRNLQFFCGAESVQRTKEPASGCCRGKVK